MCCVVPLTSRGVVAVVIVGESEALEGSELRMRQGELVSELDRCSVVLSAHFVVAPEQSE